MVVLYAVVCKVYLHICSSVVSVFLMPLLGKQVKENQIQPYGTMHHKHHILDSHIQTKQTKERKTTPKCLMQHDIGTLTQSSDFFF